MSRWALFCAGASMMAMVWLGAASDQWRHAYSFTGQQADYYNLLVDGFLEGHLYLKAEMHPGRLSPDIEVRKRSPSLLDAAEYRGHYYLYYGVVPAVTVLLPYSAATGHDLSLNVATVGFVLFGFLASLAWYADLRRQLFPSGAAIVDCAAVMMLAFGPATAFLVRRSMFYELPLAAGYAFLCAFLWAATRALLRPDRSARWIALASAFVGMAAGCHPNHALLTLPVALVAWWVHRAGRPAWIMAAAAILPAAVMGGALAWYNYARFGNPFDFGFNYGVNGFFETKDQLFSAAFLWPNFRWYYLVPPTLLPYFPFVFPADATFRPPGYHGAEAIHGQFLVSLLLAWIGAGLICFRAGKWAPLTRRLAFLCGYAFVTAAIFICLLGIRANRYLVDFQFPLIALGVLFAAQIGQLPVRSLTLRAWRIGLMALALLAAAGTLLAAVQLFDLFRYTRPASFDYLSHRLNPSWAFWQKLGLTKTGTLTFDVSFPVRARPVYEPLLTIGVPGYSDSVYAIQHPGNLLELAIDHFGYGGPRSAILHYEPGRTYAVQIELGGFYPPETDPYFANCPVELMRHIKTTARIDFDGQTVIDENVPLYEAAPWQRELGSNLTTHTAFARNFSGELSRVRWLPPPSLSERIAWMTHSPVMRLTTTIPAEMPGAGQPLVAFGRTGHGTLLFLRPTGPGQWNLCLDEWGFASPPAVPVTIPPGEHTFDIFIGPRATDDAETIQAGLAGALQPHQRELRVWMDGRPFGNFSLRHYLDTFADATPGANPQGFSTSEAQFYTPIVQRPLNRTSWLKILQRVIVEP